MHCAQLMTKFSASYQRSGIAGAIGTRLDHSWRGFPPLRIARDPESPYMLVGKASMHGPSPSVNLRRRVVKAIAAGHVAGQAAARFGVSASSAIRCSAE